VNNDPTKDPLALGLGSLATGVGFGGACLTAAQIIASLLRQRFESPADPLLAGLIVAVGVGGACGWYRSFPLDNIWQRGVISVLAAVGAVLVGFLAAPLDRFFGLVGMLVWLAVNAAFGIVGTRWAIRGKGTGDAGGETGTP
jgi:MFS-type transporter involved in bile tolerance (Atg22 family)